MKQLLIIFFCSLTIVASAQEPVRVIPKPSTLTAIADLANILDDQEEQLLNDHLTNLKRSSSNEIAIATIGTLNGGSLEEVANATYRSWAIGTAKNNNGILILVVKDDRKMKIEVGYGLEGAIPDAVAGSIIRNDMKPFFQKGDYYHGILRAVEDLEKAAVGEYNIPQENSGGAMSGRSIFKFIIIAIVILIFIGRSGGGGKGGKVMHRRGSDWLGPMILGSMLGGRGGGFGGGGGGGFGGGGFGGFGGGSSGGGGASGNW
jgi:uncharacterized protein